MPLRFHKKWPRAFGFEIYGKGPCYVINVEKGSIAHKAGLMSGDQLLEVNGHDVINMSAKQVRALGKNGTNQPPELEVVSCLQTHVIKPHHVSGYGLKVSNKRPVIISSVVYGGPAHQSGLRVGDIILEANSHVATSLNTLATVLSQQQGRLTLLTIPVARTSNIVQVDKTLSRITEPDPRLFRAKDLHNKLDNLMGSDHRRKMAVVAALKQYAEDRDITILCSALSDLLRTKSHRNILKYIRLLIPPAQRPQFDDLINFKKPVETAQLANFSSGGIISRTKHHMGQRKLIQVVREAGSFGFIIKSCGPAFIESIDPGGAAENAGLEPGDYLIKLNGIDIRKCDHDQLVQLLQDSGSCPTLEVLRCAKSAGILNTGMSSSSSSSSHNSIDNILFSNVILDKEGNSFTEKANFLLTSKEWNIMKKAVRSYDVNRNIILLYNSLSAILDNPSKKMLWPFLFVLLSSPHREYVSHHVNMPSEVLLGIVQSDGEHSSNNTDGQKFPQEPDMVDFPPSFKQQADFLLTSAERSQFKKCLEEYKRHNDLNTLKTVESILDTPSKKMLWRFVMPHMISEHKEILRERLELYDLSTASSSVSVASMDSYIGSAGYDNEGAQAEIVAHTDDDILYGGYQLFHKSSESSSDESEYSDSPPRNRKWMKGKSKVTDNDLIVMRDLEDSKKSVQDVKNGVIAQGKYMADENGENEEYLDCSRYVTIIPVGNLSQKLDHLPFHNQPIDLPQLKYAETQNTSFIHHDIHSESSVSSSSDDDSVKGMEVGYDLIDSKYSRQSHSDVSPLEQLNEACFVDSIPKQIHFNSDDRNEEGKVVRITLDNKQHLQPPPPPPPPVPPSLLYAGLGSQESSDRMNVKRINWEKLDNKSVQNTIWEKLSDHDLSEVVRYLELETQFSTKPSHRSVVSMLL